MAEESALRRAGFANPSRASRQLASDLLRHVNREWLVANCASSADPDQALLGYLRLLESATRDGAAALQALYYTCEEPAATGRLFAVLGMSTALSERLIARPTLVHILQDVKIAESGIHTSLEREQRAALAAVGAETSERFPVACGSVEDLREHYWYRLTQIAAVDLTSGPAPDHFDHVSRALSDLVGGTLEAALALARAQTNVPDVGLAVIAMGKTGGRELNYISDVDLIYVARSLSGDDEATIAGATKLAEFISKAVAAPGASAPILDIDTALRPEGKNGPLVRTLDSHVAYYERWAQNWEFQALLKARPVAGDMELGEHYVEAIEPFVWGAAGREGFVEDTRAMRRRVEDSIPSKDADRNIKLGRGGLRDIEFTVQLLQIVHGRTDPSVRQRSTLEALDALQQAGYMSRRHARDMAGYYRLLRSLEHRVQLQRIRRSHTLPRSEQELRRIARSLGLDGVETAADLEELWAKTRRKVRALHLEIYYRPMLPATAKLSPDAAALEPEAAQARLSAIGYRDPSAAYANAVALTTGLNRTAAIQRQILPVMLEWFADGPEPDHGLASFRDVSEALGTTSWYMRLLRDSRVAARRLAQLLSSSRYVARELPSLAESISWLDDDALLQPLSAADVEGELDSMLARRSEATDIANAGRALRRRELLRTAMADVLGIVDDDRTRAAISSAGHVAVEAALRGARIAAGAPEDLKFAVIALGRFGGEELGYVSDADVLFVYDHAPSLGSEDAHGYATQVAQHLMSLLSGGSEEPPFPADADLRPEGKNGPIARSLASYAAYYDQWVEAWERQALLRARFLTGDREVGRAFIEMIEPLRYPARGLDAADVRKIRSMKARIERERIPRGVDPTRHLKLGPGGLSDVEWTAQLLQLRHAGTVPQLRTLNTVGVLHAASEAGLISEDDTVRLTDAWSFASALRDANVLGTGRSRGSKIDVLPSDSRDLALIAVLLGRDITERHAIDEDYARIARRARRSVETIFYKE